MAKKKPAMSFEDEVYDLLSEAVGFVNNGGKRDSGVSINFATMEISTREGTAKKMLKMMYRLKPERFEVVKEPAKKPTKRKAAASQPAEQGRETNG